MRRPVKKRAPIEPDSRHSSVLVAKFVNRIMQEGKKSVAMRIVYEALDLAAKKMNKPALEVFETALQNAGPNMELKSRRICGANYQVPIEVKPERRVSLAMR